MSNHMCVVCGGENCPFMVASFPKSADEEKVPHQIHITVDSMTNPEIFQTACRQIGVKAHVLKNVQPDGSTFYDLLTSETVFGTVAAKMRLNRVSTLLCEQGFTIIRRKIEAAPWHPLALTLQGAEIVTEHDKQYYEAHIKVDLELGNDLGRRVSQDRESGTSANAVVGMNFQRLHATVNKISQQLPPYFTTGLSINTTKETEVIVTLRASEGYMSSFTEQLTRLSHALHDQGFQVLDDQVIEFALYDDNIAHDSSWIGHQRRRAIYAAGRAGVLKSPGIGYS